MRGSSGKSFLKRRKGYYIKPRNKLISKEMQSCDTFLKKAASVSLSWDNLALSKLDQNAARGLEAACLTLSL